MTQINTNLFRDFITKTIGGNSIKVFQAEDFNIKKDDFVEADIDESDDLDIDEILDNKNLYEQFATLYEEEKENESESVNAEKEKEELLKVQQKGGAGI